MHGCEHVTPVAVTDSARFPDQGCAECDVTGTTVALRQCLQCGHVGCCDSSPGSHATAHYRETGHPIMRSVERGDDWGWCYLDELVISPAPNVEMAAVS